MIDENKFKQNLVKELKERFPDCMIFHLDPNEIQGVPYILILNGGFKDRNARKQIQAKSS